MRYDTFVAAHHFVVGLQETGVVAEWYEDGDMMFLRLKTGEKIMVYLIEYPLSVQNILHHLTTNTAQNIYSLFIFWSDMFLPAHDDWYDMDDWMEAMASVQGQLLYGFEVAGRDAFFFPVYLDGTGHRRRVRHGENIQFEQLSGFTIETNNLFLQGQWRIATFAASINTHQLIPPIPSSLIPLSRYFETLGLYPTTNLDSIKKSYRDLARQFHPDLNTSETAHQRMMQINDAYQRISEFLNPET